MSKKESKAKEKIYPQRPAHVPEPGGKEYDRYLLKRSILYFLPYKKLVIIAFIATVVASLGDAGTAWLVKPALDKVFLAKDRTYLLLIPLAFIVVTLLKNSSRLLQYYLMQFVGLKVIEALRDQLFTKIIRLPLRYYEKAQVGHLMARVINDVILVRSSLPALINIVRSAISLVALTVVVYSMDLMLAVLGTIVLPVAILPFLYFSKRIRKLSRKGQALYADASVVLNEILNGVRVVKTFSTESAEAERFDSENRRLLRVNLKQAMAGEFSSASMELIAGVALAVVIYIGGVRVINGLMTTGEFFAFVVALGMMYEPIKKITGAFNSVQNSLAGAERVFELIDSAENVEESGGDIEVEAPLKNMEMRFENVNFSYGEEMTALRDINLEIREGERIAIVGPSGAGKTTFINLIPRFYDPSSGRITLNGVDLRDYKLDSLRNNISIVSQDNFLFNFTVRDNIAYGQPGFSDEQVIAAAKAAYAHDFIMEMPEGYDTLVGERGVRLSGGQKQRLTIARAIAKNSPILILDEATSALDSESEKIVQKALENLMQDRTSIVIAHRLSTVLSSDRIVVMEDGAIEAVGSHKELLETSPLYAKLYAMQFGEGEE